MKKRFRVKMGLKLGVALGLMLVLFIATIALAISLSRNTALIVNDFYDRQFQVTVLARSISANIEGISRRMLQAITAEDAEAAAALREKTVGLSETAQEEFLRLDALYQGGEGLRAEMLVLTDAMPKAREAVWQQVEQGNYAAALDAFQQSYAPLVEKAQDYANIVYAEADAEAMADIQRIETNTQNLTVGSLFITVVIGGFALAMSTTIIRSITVPVARLKTASEQIAMGYLRTNFEVNSTDELGDLAASIRQTASSLSGYISEIDKALVALGEGDLDYQAPDIFQGDFVAVRQSIQKIALLLKEQRLRNEAAREALMHAYDVANSANQAKSDFLSRMSHDMRTPLNAIIGLTAIAGADAEDPAKVRDNLRKISSSSKHLLGLINDILDMSKIESGNMTLNCDEVTLSEIIGRIITIIQPQFMAKGQQFNVRAHQVQNEGLYCDPLRLNQVLINILSNAVKFTPDGGRIDLDIEELPSERAGHACFRFTVTDTGIGMKQEFLDEIFSAFTREHDSMVDQIEGSGLGMAISKRIVDLMDGDIRVESEPGVGSTFTVEVWLQTAQGAQPVRAALPGVRVLVVDEDEAAAQSVAATLCGTGLRAEWACDSTVALEHMDAAIRARDEYRLVIVDCALPGKAGVETARAIRARFGGAVPIIMSSAYDLGEVQQAARGAGTDEFIAKPLFPSTIYGYLRYLELDSYENPDVVPEEEIYDFTGYTVLLVDDNEINRLIAEEIILPTGAEVETAGNGAEALQMFEQAPVGKYHLVLMDVQMPVMGGYEATRRIRALPREDAATVPIFALTANAFSEDIAAAREAGMNYHLAKPLDITQMMRKMREYLLAPPAH